LLYGLLIATEIVLYSKLFLELKCNPVGTFCNWTWQRGLLAYDVIADEDLVGEVDEEEHDEGAKGRSGLGNDTTPEINFTNHFL
jgi:hypothetical protein